MEAAPVVFINERLVVLNKPPGVSLATRRSEPLTPILNLLALIPAETVEAYGLDSQSLWLVHRLDVNTSGLTLLARDQDMHRQVVSAFQKRTVEKQYLALVWGHPHPVEGTCCWPLAPDSRDRRRMRVDRDGRPAKTRYKTIASARHISLLELRPETGRTHQLRVHLSHSGHWIVGDDLYCGPRYHALKDKRLLNLLNPPHLLLHAWRLELPSIRGLEALKFEAPLPPHFAAALEAIPRTAAVAGILP